MRTSPLFLAALLLSAACSGSSDNTSPTGPGNVNAAITATMNGTAWGSTASAKATWVNTTLTMVGWDGTRLLTIAVVQATAPATYSLAFGNTPGNLAIVTDGSGKAWDSYAAGGTGSITISSISATGASGTFSFTGIAGNAATTGNLNVTNGKFNVQF